MLLEDEYQIVQVVMYLGDQLTMTMKVPEFWLQ